MSWSKSCPGSGRRVNCDEYEEAAKRVRVIRIALPGTYAQLQIPGRLEREWAKQASQKELIAKARTRGWR